MIRSTLLLGILFLSHFFLFGESFANNTTDITKPTFKIDLQQLDPVNSASQNIPSGQAAATGLLAKIADFLFFVIPLIAAVSLIIAGYYYILSSGDSEKASRAKTIIKWNMVAILVAMFSYVIIAILSRILDGEI